MQLGQVIPRTERCAQVEASHVDAVAHGLVEQEVTRGDLGQNVETGGGGDEAVFAHVGRGDDHQRGGEAERAFVGLEEVGTGVLVGRGDAKRQREEVTCQG